MKWLSTFNVWENGKDIFRVPDRRIPSIDGIRALSVLYILLFHTLMIFSVIAHGKLFMPFVNNTPWYLQWILAGDRAVDTFFVVSGFLISSILFHEFQLKQSVSLKRFFLRRWLRLTPAYYTLILLVLLFLPKKFELLNLILFATYLNNFLPCEQSNYIALAWSLAIEEQFYLLFGLFMAFLFCRVRKPIAFFSFLFVLSLCIRAYLLNKHPEFLIGGDQLLVGSHISGIGCTYWESYYDNLYTRFGPLILGVMLGYLQSYHADKIHRWLNTTRSNLLLLLALALIGLVSTTPIYNGEPLPHWMSYSYMLAHRHLFALGISLIMLTAFYQLGAANLMNRFLSLKLFYPIAQLSYAIYLLHMPIMTICVYILNGFGLIPELNYSNILWVLIFSLVPIFIFSTLLFVLIERPFMRMREFIH